MEDCTLEQSEQECVLDSARLAAALARLPARYREMQDAGALVQPADARGQRWVLNRPYEGTGRYGSRYTSVMPEHLRERYTAWIAERAVRDRNGQRAEFLDLMFNFGEMLNVLPDEKSRVVLVKQVIRDGLLRADGSRVE